MYSRKTQLVFKFLLAVIVLFSLTFLWIEPVEAVTTCTWQGTTTDWYDTDNWSECLDGSGSPTYPNDTRDVIIPAGQATYPVLTGYQDQVDMNTLTIDADAQITIDEQTTFLANQVDNYGTIRIQDVNGHNLRIQAPFNNYGVVNSGIYAALILYESGIHTGTFTGKQLSIFQSPDTERINTFQIGSSIDVSIIFAGEYNSINIYGSVISGTTYIRTNSVVDISASQSADLGMIVLQGGEIIASAYNISSGETFSGTGTIESNVTNAGTVSPGASPGIITVDGDYTQTADGILEIQLGGTNAATPDFDQLIVTGFATLSGTLNVSLINDFEPQVGDSFFIIDHSGEGSSGTGTFDTVSLPTLDGGLKLESDFSDEGVTLTVIDGGGSGGSISGTVTCNSTYTVFVDIWAGNTEPPPYRSITINCGDSYSFTDLPDGTYYVGAWIDLNESGDGPPDLGEPYAWYGDPTAVEITGGNSQSGIDITFPSSNTGAIEGTVTCDSIHPVFVDLWASTTNPEPELSTTIACGGSYSFTNLPNGTYYVGAWIDLNESGDGPPDPGEPYVWYGDQTAVTITGGETKSGIDITFPAESFQLFLPLIVK